MRRRETTWNVVSWIGIVTEIDLKEAHFGDVDRIHLRQTSDQLVAVANLVIDNNINSKLHCNNNNFINNFNQLIMFRTIISPILRSSRLCLHLVV